MIKKLSVFISCIVLILLSLSFGVVYADVNQNGSFISSEYSYVVPDIIRRVRSDSTSYEIGSVGFASFDFTYNFESRLFYPNVYWESVPQSALYQSGSNSFAFTDITFSSTSNPSGFICFDFTSVTDEYLYPISPPTLYFKDYLGVYFYYFNGTSVNDTSFDYVNIITCPLNSVPSVLKNQYPNINFSNSNYFNFFGSTLGDFCYYRIYDFVTNLDNHFYIVFLTSRLVFSSSIYYFNQPSDTFDTGYIFGYSDGFTDGASSDVNVSFENGYNSGYDVGYALGRSRGYTEAIDSGAGENTFIGLITSALDVPLRTFYALTDYEFLGINLKQFFFSLLTVGLLLFVIKLLFK